MTLHRFTRSAALALAVAAVAAPTAAAQQDMRNPDQRNPAPAGEPRQDFRSPDTQDYADGRGTYNAPGVVVVKVREPQAAPAAGIDWGDAGIGAGTLLGFSLLGIGGALLLVHRKQVAPAAGAGG